MNQERKKENPPHQSISKKLLVAKPDQTNKIKMCYLLLVTLTYFTFDSTTASSKLITFHISSHLLLLVYFTHIYSGSMLLLVGFVWLWVESFLAILTYFPALLLSLNKKYTKICMIFDRSIKILLVPAIFVCWVA